MNKKLKIFSIMIVILLVLFLLALPKLNSGGKEQVHREEQGAGPLSVSAHIIQPENLKNIVTVRGSILANEEVELKSETAGIVYRNNRILLNETESKLKHNYLAPSKI